MKSNVDIDILEIYAIIYNALLDCKVPQEVVWYLAEYTANKIGEYVFADPAQ